MHGGGCRGQLGIEVLGAVAAAPGAGCGVMNGHLPGGASMVARSWAGAMSGDGVLLAGTGESERGVEAFVYSAVTGAFTPLGDLAGGAFTSFATGMSADGSVVVG